MKNPIPKLETATWQLFLLCLIVLAAGIGLRDPWPADEPRFVLAAKQMIESGQWWFTQRGNELYSDKPPLFMWLQALSFKVTGSWRLAFLLPSLIAAMGSLYLLFDLTKRLYDERIARQAVAILLVTVQFSYQMKRAQIDPVLFGFTTIAAYGFLRHYLIAASWSWLYLGWFFVGLGIITKGVGFLPLFLLLTAAIMRRKQWQHMAPQRQASWWKSGMTVLVMLLPIAIWLIPMSWQAYGGNDPQLRAYADDLLFRQTGQRLVNAWHHHHPFWYFGQVILTTWIPLSLLLPWLIAPWRVAWRLRDSRVWLPLCGAMLMVVFFSLSKGKRDMYIMPALPLFVLACVPFVDAVMARVWARRVWFGFAMVLASALLLAALLALFGEPKFELKLEMQRGLAESNDRVWQVLAAIGSTGLVAAIWFRRHAMHAVFAVLSLLWIGYGLGLAPVLNGANSGRDLMRKVDQHIGPNAELAMLGWREQHYLQAVRTPVVFGFKRDMSEQINDAVVWLSQSPNRHVLADADEVRGCLTMDSTQRRFGTTNRRDWLLLGAGDLRSACVPKPTDLDE